MDQISKFKISNIAFHLLAIAFICGALLLLTYPILLNADIFLDGDEAFNANAIVSLLEGEPFFFYYPGQNYVGILDGLTAVPFFGLLGTHALAFQLPAILYYSLYIWTSCLIVGHFSRGGGYITGFLMLFPPVPAIFTIITMNIGFPLILFLGNVVFLLFIKAKSSRDYLSPVIFFLFFTMGLAIYSFTYCIVHIFTILILSVLTWREWGRIRPYLSFAAFSNLFKNLPTKRDLLVRVFDVVIGFFFLAIAFSYIFGGFGLDIGGVTILQINKLHKPVLQVIGIIIVRILIAQVSLAGYVKRFKTLIPTWDPASKRLAGIAFAGFAIGISPRMASILTGQTKSGGQGFDMDFLPVKLAVHFWDMLTHYLPDILGVYDPIRSMFSGEPLTLSSSLFGLLLVVVLGLLLLSVQSFYAANWSRVKKLATLQALEFSPQLIVLFFPVLIVVALTLSMNGPDTHNLIALYGMIIVWVAVYLDKIRKQSFVFFLVLLSIWAGFFLWCTYKYYKEQSIIQGYVAVKKQEPLLDVIDFLKSKEIPAAYGNYNVANRATFLSQGSLDVAEYSITVRGKSLKAKAAQSPRFAIILNKENESLNNIYQDFMERQQVSYQEKSVGSYRVFWGFEGNPQDIERLRAITDDAKPLN